MSLNDEDPVRDGCFPLLCWMSGVMFVFVFSMILLWVILS